MAALIAVLLVASCGQSTAPTVSPAASTNTESAYQQLFGQVGPNGEVTKEMALEAFSLAIAPLPGVTVPTGAPPTNAERADGTFAIDWIRQYFGELTADQQAAVNAALKPVLETMQAAPRQSKSQSDIALASYAESDLRALVAADIPVIEGKLGRTLSYDTLIPQWYVTLNPTEVKPNNIDALAYECSNISCELSSGSVNVPADYCIIAVNPSLVASGDDDLVKSTMAHELFHCFQDDLLINKGGWQNAPSWIIEGQAEWAGEMVGALSDAGATDWGMYLAGRKKPLWSRSYDALGFYQQLADDGIDPWKHFDAMLEANSNESAFTAAGATDPLFLDDWASGEFKNASLGQSWNAYGPWLKIGAPPPDVLDIADGDQFPIPVNPVTVNNTDIESAAEVTVVVLISGNARIHTDPPTDEILQPSEPRLLCTMIGGCACPANQHYEGPQLDEVGPTIDLGITGGLTGAEVDVAGTKLDPFCKPGPTPTPQPSCQSNCGHSNGDPHLRTTNHYVYAFQAAGEFTLLRNADSSIDVQARQEPYSSLRYPGVSTNTAVAARDNGHSIGVYVEGDSLVLHVDGEQVDPSAIPDLGSGAYVHQVTDGYEIGFPDGSTLDALSVGHWGINAIVDASQSLLSAGVGILGPITPGGMGVPALPDGTQLPVAPDTITRNKILYSTFADAWRVTDAASLFDYDPGKTTESYTDRNFPSDADQAALDTAFASPDPAQQQAAQSACAALTDPDLQSDCQYDVFATGDDGFAQTYAATQDLYDSGVVSTNPPSEPPATQGAPATPGPVTGATKVTELSHFQSATIGPDNTVYASIDDSSAAQQPQLIAFDPTTGSIKAQTPMRVETDIHFAAGSVWASGQAADADGHNCTVTRYDPQTLAKQGDYPIPCSAGFGAPRLTSMGDAVWFISNDGTQLTQIDPTSNVPGKSVPLGYAGGCCQDSQGAVFCFCGNSDVWRLMDNDPAFVDMVKYTQVFPAGTGFWAAQDSNAVYVDGPGAPSTTLPLNDGSVVGGDPTGVYLQGVTSDTSAQATPAPYDQLSRQPADGSAPEILNAPPVASAGTINETDFDYLTGGFPWFATRQGYAHVWEFKEPPDGHDALWIQWSPLP